MFVVGDPTTVVYSEAVKNLTSLTEFGQTVKRPAILPNTP